MHIFLRILILLVAVITAACGDTDDRPQTTGADIVLTNGRIYTVDANRSWAEAVAITDGVIVNVGSAAEVAAAIGSSTTVVDLAGRMVLPAFQDSHIHPISAGLEASACDLNAASDLAGYRAVIGEYAAANPDVGWILGGGWSMPVFGAGGAPSKNILDELVPDRPVFLSSADGHSGWANSRALEIAGITRDTPNPVDGIIDRDPDTGALVGSLQEGAMNLVQRHIPLTSLADRRQGLLYSQKMLHGFGITSIQDAIVNRKELETYASLEAADELKLRVVASLWWDREKGEEQIENLLLLREEYGDSTLVRPTTVKIMQDGVLENYTAAMLQPYLEGGGTLGIPMIAPERLKQVVPLLDVAGFQVHFHAIGDAAIRQALDAIEEAQIQNGALGNRHHISHLQVVHPDDIPRFAELDVIANFQPLWANADPYVLELNVPAIGEERTSWMYPIKSIQDSGGLIAFGSDWSVSTANPFPQMETAIDRLGALDEGYPPFTQEERIDLESAIAAFTINAAFLNKHEEKTGSIEVGKLGDLIVIDKNLFDIDTVDISETKVLLTLFGGQVVHGDLATL